MIEVVADPASKHPSCVAEAAQIILAAVVIGGVATIFVEYGGHTKVEQVMRWLALAMGAGVLLPMAGLAGYRLVARRWKKMPVPAAVLATLSFLPGVFMFQDIVGSLDIDLARSEVSMKGWGGGANEAAKAIRAEGRVLTVEELRPYAASAMHEAAARNGLTSDEESAILAGHAR